MPVMNRFEWLEACDQLPEPLKGPHIVNMLTRSLEADDKVCADSNPHVASDMTKTR
jgi:hypothetical protein